MFNTWKKLESQSVAIKTLWGVIAALIMVNAFAFLLLANVPNRIRIFIPPDLSQGAVVMQKNIPKSTVYAFAFQMFTAINSWPDSGVINYKQNILAYKRYLSAQFEKALLKDQKTRALNGALSRKRLMSVSGGYSPNDVKVLGNGTYVVTLDVELLETVDAAVVKHVVMAYPLVVRRVNASMQINPWGLEIVGYQSTPYRIKTII